MHKVSKKKEEKPKSEVLIEPFERTEAVVARAMEGELAAWMGRREQEESQSGSRVESK